MDALVAQAEASADFELAPVFLRVPAVWMHVRKSGDCLYNKRTIWLWAAVEKKVFKDVLSENFPYETQRERT